MLISGLILFIGILSQSCDDNPDKYVITDGIPEVYYIRVPNPESADSLLVAAYMNNTIALIGKILPVSKKCGLMIKSDIKFKFYHV